MGGIGRTAAALLAGGLALAALPAVAEAQGASPGPTSRPAQPSPPPAGPPAAGPPKPSAGPAGPAKPAHEDKDAKAGKAKEKQDEKRKKTPDLVTPPPALARILARFDGEAEPGRELKRAFVSVVYYLLDRDLERLLPYFHPDLRIHLGEGRFKRMPPAALRKMFTERLKGAPKLPPLLQAMDLSSIRVYSRSRAAKVDAKKAGWRIEPARVATEMQDGDWLVMARLKTPKLPPEVFYVFRRDGDHFKIVLGE